MLLSLPGKGPDIHLNKLNSLYPMSFVPSHDKIGRFGLEKKKKIGKVYDDNNGNLEETSFDQKFMVITYINDICISKKVCST